VNDHTHIGVTSLQQIRNPRLHPSCSKSLQLTGVRVLL